MFRIQKMIKDLLKASILFQITAQGQPCIEETQMYGSITIVPGTHRENFYYRNDDFARITKITGCSCCDTGEGNGRNQHFRGIEIETDGPGGLQTHQYGTVGITGLEPQERCETMDVSQEELMYFTIFSDSNDIEGIDFEGNKGTQWSLRANGNDSQRFRMKGRPVGFRIWEGDYPLPNGPVKMSVVYNSCNCPASTFEGIAFADMECSVKPNQVLKQKVEFQPNYMQSVYEQDCGVYAVEISPSLPFFEIQTSGTSVENGFAYPDVGILDCSTNDNIGEHIVNMVIKQDIDEPTHGFNEPYRGVVPVKLVPFTIKINPCQVEELVIEPISDINYDVGDPETYSEKFSVKQIPECGYQINYKVLDSQGDWFEVRSADSDLKVQTNDFALGGVYTLQIQAFVDVFDDYTKTNKTTVTTETELIVNLISPCQQEKLIVENVIPDQVYSIGVDGLVSLTAEYNNSEPQCPKTYSIKRIVDGIEQEFSEIEQKVISSDFEKGMLRINTNNFTLHNEIWTIKLSITSIYSLQNEKEAVFQFDILFKDFCWEADVTPAQPIQPNFNFDLLQRQMIKTFPMVDNSNGADVCGGYTYTLEYAQGYFYNPLNPTGADLSFYEETIYSSYVQYTATVKENEWIGTHVYRIKSTLGRFDPAVGSRGKNGFYNSFFSEPFTVEIVDPCQRSIVNQDSSFFVDELIVPNEKKEQKFFFSGPTDSTSKKYGNGYNICGPLNYSFLDDSTNDRFELSGFSNSVIKSSNVADLVSFSLMVNPYGGANIQTKFTLVAALADYPTATPFTQEVFVTYRGCYPPEFKGSLIKIDPMMVGDPAFEIPVLFDQSPCMYDQEYTTVVYDRQSGDKVDIPKFMRPLGDIILIDEPQTVDIGEYRVITCSTLNTFVEQLACIEFDLTVGPRPINFLYKVFDQKVKVGESLVYDLGMPVGNYDYLLKVDAFLGEAYRFTSFNSTTNVLEVYGDLTKADYVGEYLIVLTAQLMIGEKFDKVYKRQFRLIVWDDPKVDLPWFPTNPIYYDEWNAPIVRANYSQEFSPERPIPYIKELRTDGLLTIGWDRNMIVPQNYKEIEPAKVAVETGFVRRETRKWQDGRKVRKLGRSYEQFAILEDDLEHVYFADRNTGFFEQMKLLDALEILITPQDDEQQAESIPILTWEIIGYSSDQILLQLTFDDYQGIAMEEEYDTLSVTFWGIQFFKSNSNDKEVALGTTLYHQLSPQISKYDAGLIDGFTGFLKGLLITSLILVALVMPFGSLLPFWNFINSLQIISHMILLKSVMPAPIFWFLKSQNDVIRWYDPALVDTLQQMQDWRRYSSSFENFHELLQASDYTPQIALNMAWISLVLACLLLIWFIVALKDYIVSFSPQALKHGFLSKIDSSMCQNFILRYVYVFWLEFCICVILEISTRDYRSFYHSLQYLTAVICLLVMFAILCFIVSLFLRGAGPQILGFYKPSTVSKSFLFEHRDRDQGFDGKKWLKINKEKQDNRPRGSFFIRFDPNRYLNALPCGRKDRPEDPNFIPILDLNDLEVFEYKTKAQDADENESKFLVKSEGVPTERCLLTNREEVPIILIPLNISQETNITNQRHQLERSNEVSERKDEIQQKPIVVSQISQEKTEQGVYNISFYEGGQKDVANDDTKVFTKHESFAKFKETIDARQKKQSNLGSEKISKDVLNLWASKEAHLRVKFASRMKVDKAYKTLFFGLKLNTERNSAIVHPLMFLIRRLIYALIILFLDSSLHFGILLVLFCTLLMLAYALTEFQWEERVINWQHISNEIVIYMTCVAFLFFFSNAVSDRIRWNVSYILIGILCSYILANTAFIAYYASIQLKLLYKRVYVQRKRRRFLIQAWLKIQELHEQFLKDKQLKKQKAKVAADIENLGSQHNFDCKLIRSELELKNIELNKPATSLTGQQDQKRDLDCISIIESEKNQEHSQGLLQILIQGDEQTYQKDTKIESDQECKNDRNLLIAASNRDQISDVVSKSETFGGSVSVNNFNSEHGLVFSNYPIDLNEICEEAVHLDYPVEPNGIIQIAPLDQNTLRFTRSRTDNKISIEEVKPSYSEITNQQEFKPSLTKNMNQENKKSPEQVKEEVPVEMHLDKLQIQHEVSVNHLRPSKSDMKGAVDKKNSILAKEAFDQKNQIYKDKESVQQTSEIKDQSHLPAIVELTPKVYLRSQVEDSLDSKKVLQRQNTDQKGDFDSELQGSILKNSGSFSLQKLSNGQKTPQTEYKNYQRRTNDVQEERSSPRLRFDQSVDEIYQAMGRQSPKSNNKNGFNQYHHTRGINSKVFHQKQRLPSQTSMNQSSLSQYNDICTIQNGANYPNQQRTHKLSSNQGNKDQDANHDRTSKVRQAFEYYQRDLSKLDKDNPQYIGLLSELDSMQEQQAQKAFRSKSKTERKRGTTIDMSPMQYLKHDIRREDQNLEKAKPLTHTGMSILGTQPQRSFTQTKQYVCQTEKRKERRNRSRLLYFEKQI